MPRRSRAPEIVSHNMSRVRAVGSLMEVRLGRSLRAAGLRYRKQYPVTGKPDFALPELKIAIFCDSHFWHGYRWNRGAKEAIKTRREFWIPKIERNIQRDKEVTRILRRQGWLVLRFWQHELERAPERCVGKVLDAVNKRTKGVR